MSIYMRLKEAKDEYAQAIQNFNYAEEPYIEAAALGMAAAKAKLDAVLKDMKEGGTLVGDLPPILCTVQCYSRV